MRPPSASAGVRPRSPARSLSVKPLVRPKA
jgi:hypothetical protein